MTSAHLARTAYLYVRQSTLRQVLTNTESTARQYALRQKAIAFGWPAEQIVTIDTDQGQSGASAADREGFQRLVADVSMGRAWIVLGAAGLPAGPQQRRLASAVGDLCHVGDTDLRRGRALRSGRLQRPAAARPEGHHERGRAALHPRARLIGGQRSKARRGELQMPLPVGLVDDPAGKLVLDPDTSVQQAIRHVFAQFARAWSARATVQQFNAEHLLFPVRVRTGARKGELAWMPLQHWRVLRTLHNPRYAGAFAYGRRRERLAANGKKTLETLPREQWIALIRDAHPGYISWDQYETNQRPPLANAAAHGEDRAAGPAREGTALLQGLAICGRCGRRMTVRYHTRRGVEVPDYQCINHCIQNGGRRCQSVPGATVDAAVGQLLLDTLTPLALEVALTVQTELDTRAAEADALRRAHVERARHRADLARRRYLAVDPNNRLVADSLEADWNDALRALQAAREDYEKASASAALTEGHKARIRSLEQISLLSGRTRIPPSATENAWSASSSTTSPCTRPTASNYTFVCAADRPPASPSLSRRRPGSSAKPTPTPSQCWTSSSTPAPTPRPPTRSTPPATAPARVSNSPPVSCSKRAAVTTCPATPTGSAPKASSPKPRSLPGSACTPAPSRAGPARESLTPTRQTTRTCVSTNHPPPATPASPHGKAAPSENEFPPNPRQEVHYEAKPLS